MQVLVLEASTSSAKAMLYDDKKGIIAYNCTPYSGETSDSETHDAEGVYTALLKAGREAAEALGIKSGIPVVPVHPDGDLNQVGAGALTPGIMTLSVGTSAGIRMAFNKPVLHEKGGTWCYYAPGRWLCGSAISGAANCVDWFSKKVHGDRLGFAELEREIESSVGEPPVFCRLYTVSAARIGTITGWDAL